MEISNHKVCIKPFLVKDNVFLVILSFYQRQFPSEEKSIEYHFLLSVYDGIGQKSLFVVSVIDMPHQNHISTRIRNVFQCEGKLK